MSKYNLPIKTGFFSLMVFLSKNGAMAVSSVPNSESIPSSINIKKNKIAHNGETSMSNMASDIATKASPGPEPI